MLFTFVMGAFCLWLFVTACEIRYQRTLLQKLLELSTESEAVKRYRHNLQESQSEILKLHSEILELKLDVDPKLQKRVEYLHEVIDGHYEKLKEEKIKNAELTCELVKLKDKVGLKFDANEKTYNTNIMAGRFSKEE